MITTGKFRITCPGAKRKKEEDVEEPRTLSDLDLHLVREWYDKKDSELFQTRGEPYITERNLSSAARQYHNDSMNAHAKTHESLAEIKAEIKEGLSCLHKKIHKIEKGTPSKRRKRDAEAPKKPLGGAFGCYLAKHRQAFMQQCKGQPATAVCKMAGEKWRAFSVAEKKPFEDEYALMKKAYQEAMAAFKKSRGGGQAGDAGENKRDDDGKARKGGA